MVVFRVIHSSFCIVTGICEIGCHSGIYIQAYTVCCCGVVSVHYLCDLFGISPELISITYHEVVLQKILSYCVIEYTYMTF